MLWVTGYRKSALRGTFFAFFLRNSKICCTFAANFKNVMVISEMAITKTQTHYAIL